jgi:tetratricopeptide (TPR) repeat protein
LDAYRKALALYQKGIDKRSEAYTLNSIGRIQEALGTEKQALENYQLALTLNRETRDRFGESGTLYRIAKLQQKMGRLKDAKANAEQSIALVESLRAGVASHDLRSSYVASVYQLYELYIDVLMSLHALEPQAGFAQSALEASEAGRVRTLLETLAETKTQIRAGVDPKLLDRYRNCSIPAR